MTTNNFNIAPFENSEAKKLSEMMMANESRFEQYLPKTLDQNRTIKASEAYIIQKQKEINDRECYTFGIKAKLNNDIAGLIILKNVDWKIKQGELAYGIAASFEGKGWTSQAVKELSRFAFNELGLQTLQVIAHKTNVGSCKVAEKCGYMWQKTLKNEFIPQNDLPQDMELYVLKK